MLMLTSMQILEIKKYLEKKVTAGTNKPKVKDMDPNILSAAWSILHWYIGCL